MYLRIYIHIYVYMPIYIPTYARIYIYMYIYHSCTLRMIPRDWTIAPRLVLALAMTDRISQDGLKGERFTASEPTEAFCILGTPQNRNWDVPAMRRKQKSLPSRDQENNHCSFERKEANLLLIIGKHPFPLISTIRSK